MWDEVLGTIFTDFDTEDKELQKNAFMTLIHFPKLAACEFLTSMESTLLKYLEVMEVKKQADQSPINENDEILQDFQNKCQWIEYLPEFLIKTYSGLGDDEESFAAKDIIKDLFKKIIDFIFNSDDILAVSALKGLQSLLKAYYFPNSWHFLDYKQSNSDNVMTNDEAMLAQHISENFESQSYFIALKPLLQLLMNYIMPQFPVVLYRMQWFDILSYQVKILQATNFYDTQVLMLKYLFDLGQETKPIKFEDFEGVIDFYSIASEVLSDVSKQIFELNVDSQGMGLMSYSFYRYGLFFAWSVHTSFKYKQFKNQQKDKNSERSF
jgi:hypothetical protein